MSCEFPLQGVLTPCKMSFPILMFAGAQSGCPPFPAGAWEWEAWGPACPAPPSSKEEVSPPPQDPAPRELPPVQPRSGERPQNRGASSLVTVSKVLEGHTPVSRPLPSLGKCLRGRSTPLTHPSTWGRAVWTRTPSPRRRRQSPPPPHREPFPQALPRNGQTIQRQGRLLPSNGLLKNWGCRDPPPKSWRCSLNEWS